MVGTMVALTLLHRASGSSRVDSRRTAGEVVHEDVVEGRCPPVDARRELIEQRVPFRLLVVTPAPLLDI
jgi:hypothetical protein